ncbi:MULTISPECIES: hypothetical protein [unclassified Microcoleus]|uniref:hypothetical protein n=1 Tax=unclassified Microcoleus TaxID=2642155 RepID=UPI004040B492
MRGYRSPTCLRSRESDTGWLINSQQQQVEIYRPGHDVEVRNLPTELLGENVLPEFSLNLSLY